MDQYLFSCSHGCSGIIVAEFPCMTVAKQAKLLRQRTSLMVDEEDEEEGEEKNDKKAPWGKRKKMYYSADNVDYEVSMIDDGKQ